MIFKLLHDFWDMQKAQWLLPTELLEIQSNKLRRTLSHAYSIPFYKELFDTAGCLPEDIHSAEDLIRLPITNRAMLQNAGERACALSSDCSTLITSGTSGSPLTLPASMKDRKHRMLRELRQLFANGVQFHHKSLMTLVPERMSDKQPISQRLGIFPKKSISVFLSPKEQLNWLMSYRPQVLYGYSSSIHIIAEEASKYGCHPDFLRLIITGAEMLDPLSRKRIEKSLGVKATDFYGTVEHGWIAWECPYHAGYHINSDCVVVECLKDGKPVSPAEEGELVVTNLEAEAFPAIRYSTGDVGVLSEEKCPCGRSLPLLKYIGGRVMDKVILPNGNHISPVAFLSAVCEAPGIKRFQVVQEDLYHLTIFYIPPSGLNESSELIKAAVKEVVGPDMEIDVMPVNNIELEKTGKFKLVKSNLMLR